jgi:hypothetical protein
MPGENHINIVVPQHGHKILSNLILAVMLSCLLVQGLPPDRTPCSSEIYLYK